MPRSLRPKTIHRDPVDPEWPWLPKQRRYGGPTKDMNRAKVPGTRDKPPRLTGMPPKVHRKIKKLKVPFR